MSCRERRGTKEEDARGRRRSEQEVPKPVMTQTLFAPAPTPYGIPKRTVGRCVDIIFFLLHISNLRLIQVI